MSPNKLVADSQGRHLARMGRQKGVTSQSWQERQADLMLVLEAIKSGQPISIGDWRVLEALGIEIPALKRPTLTQIREKFSWVREKEGVEGDTSPETALVLELGTVLRPDEPEITGDEYMRRRGSLTSLLGLQHGLWLVEHQDEFPDFMALLGKVYIDLPGLVVVYADGYRYFPYLRQSGERWDLRWGWSDLRLDQGGRVARSRPARAA